MARNLLFDLLAPYYNRFLGERDSDELRELLRLPTEGWLLDVGGGTGRVSSALQPLVGRVVLSDFSRPMLRQAQPKADWFVTQSSAQRLPFPDESFERVLVVDALHHFDDQPGAIRDMLRVLKPGGRMVIEEPDIRLLTVKLVALAEKLMLMESRFHTPEGIRAMIAAHGVPARLQDDGSTAARVIADKGRSAVDSGRTRISPG